MTTEPLRTYRPGTTVAATYRTPETREFAGNPLIEALSPEATRDELFRALVRLPAYHPGDRGLPAHVRANKIYLAQRFYVPLPETLDLAERIGRVIRLGYVGRNPAHPTRIKLRNEQGRSFGIIRV